MIHPKSLFSFLQQDISQRIRPAQKATFKETVAHKVMQIAALIKKSISKTSYNSKIKSINSNIISEQNLRPNAKIKNGKRAIPRKRLQQSLTADIISTSLINYLVSILTQFNKKSSILSLITQIIAKLGLGSRKDKKCQ